MLKRILHQRRSRHFIRQILTSPARLKNTLASYLSFRLKLKDPLGEPVVVDLEPSNFCNFRCPHCQVTYADWPRTELSMERFTNYLDQFPYALRIKLQGMGEPLLNKALPEMVDMVTGRNHWCEVISNGSILHTRPLGEAASRPNFQLIVSLDAAEKASFETMRPGSRFERITENLAHITATTAMNVGAWMVVTAENLEQTEEVIRLVSRLKIPSLGLQTVVLNWGQESLSEKTVAKRPHIANEEEFKRQLLAVAAAVNVRLDFSDRLFDRDHICPWPWLGAYIDVHGNTLPCCRLSDASQCTFGTLNDRPFSMIWHSPAYQAFRERIARHDLPDFCRACYVPGFMDQAP